MQTAVLRIIHGTRSWALGLSAVGALVFAGCGTGSRGNNAVTAVATSAALQGHVFGGQQPVSGSVIQLYAANQAGYGLGATALIATTVTTDAGGNFSITGDYTCPYPASQVYVTATGGNSGSGTNSSLAMMAALGPCGSLTSSTQININELTTVATAYAFSPFMSSPTQLSTSPTNLAGLANGAATVNKLVNVAIGLAPGPTLPAGATAPVAELNTLADILASCINSTGSSSTGCTTLFSAATPPGGAAPTDTLTAMLDIAKNPANNASTLFQLTPANAPFQPTLSSAPTAFTVALRYQPTGTSSLSIPYASAVDTAGNIWVANAGNNTLSVIGATTGVATTYSGGGLSTPAGIAFDSSGNAWITNRGNSSLSVFTSAGTGAVALTRNLNAPTGVAIDGQGLIWVADGGSNSITAVTASGTTVTGSTTYATGGTSPAAIAINPH